MMFKCRKCGNDCEVPCHDKEGVQCFECWKKEKGLNDNQARIVLAVRKDMDQITQQHEIEVNTNGNA